MGATNGKRKTVYSAFADSIDASLDIQGGNVRIVRLNPTFD